MKNQTTNHLIRCIAAVGLIIFAGTSNAAVENYLPLAEGERWVLRSPKGGNVVLEVTGRDKEGYRIKFDNPWGANEWRLDNRGGRVYLTGFGMKGTLLPLPPETVYFDFTAPDGAKWKNQIGAIQVLTKNAEVQSVSRTYSSCIRIKQSGNLTFTFAPGVGFVQFGEGKGAFVLDEAASSLPGATRSPQKTTSESNPVQHVPGGGSRQTASVDRRPAPDRPQRTGNNSGKLARIGITPIAFASEADNGESLVRRFQQTMDAGISFMVASGRWDEVEKGKGRYDFGGLNYQVAKGQELGIPIAYTLKLIDTVARTTPGDLKKKNWSDAEMQRRVIALIDALAPICKGQVQWFLFGNEMDGYFSKHPDEVRDYAVLYDVAAKRIKEKVPGIRVAGTLMFGGIRMLDSTLAPLNQRFDFLSFTYYPLQPDFTVQDPGVVQADFNLMEDYARNRKIILQEVGYPTSSLNRSNEAKQAEFFTNVFQELRRRSDRFEAASIFLLADLRESFVKNLAGFYGLPNAAVFKAYMQSLGLFDIKGNPKQAWSVVTSNLKR